MPERQYPVEHPGAAAFILSYDYYRVKEGLFSLCFWVFYGKLAAKRGGRLSASVPAIISTRWSRWADQEKTDWFIGVWQQDIAKDHSERTVRRCARPVQSLIRGFTDAVLAQ